MLGLALEIMPDRELSYLEIRRFFDIACGLFVCF